MYSNSTMLEIPTHLQEEVKNLKQTFAGKLDMEIIDSVLINTDYNVNRAKRILKELCGESENQMPKHSYNECKAKAPNPQNKSVKQRCVEEAVQRYHMGYKLFIIMRGLPGSGKSHLARKILDDCRNEQDYHRHIFSTDDYFTKNGIYVYDTRKLTEAHEWNQKRVLKSLTYKINPIIVDNTNTCMWEMRPYAAVAAYSGYLIEILEPYTSWCFNVKELAYKNTHNVPKDKIQMMLDRYERNVTVDKLLCTYGLKSAYKPIKYVRSNRTQKINESKNEAAGYANKQATKEAIVSYDLIDIASPKTFGKYPNMNLESWGTNENNLRTWDVVLPIVPTKNDITVVEKNEHIEVQVTTKEVSTNIQEDDLRKAQYDREEVTRNTTSRDINENTPILPRKLMKKTMLDKSSMTQEEFTDHASEANDLIKLFEMFPSIPKAYLKDVYLKCGRILEWTIELLMESDNLEMLQDNKEEEEIGEAASEIEMKSCYDRAAMEIDTTAGSSRVINSNLIDNQNLKGDSNELKDDNHTSKVDYYSLQNDKYSLKGDKDNLNGENLSVSTDNFNNHSCDLKADDQLKVDYDNLQVDNVKIDNDNLKGLFEEKFKINPLYYSKKIIQIKKQRGEILDTEMDLITFEDDIEKNCSLGECPVRKNEEVEPSTSGIHAYKTCSGTVLAMDSDADISDYSDLEDSSFSSDDDKFFELNLGKDTITQLEEKFSDIGISYPRGFQPVIQVPVNLARQLHALYIESCFQQFEMQNQILQALIKEDEELARKLHMEELHVTKDDRQTPNLKEIMNEQAAINIYQKEVEDMSKCNIDDLATLLTKQKLMKSFPDISENLLMEVYKANDRNYAETVQCLISSVNTVPKDDNIMEPPISDKTIEDMKSAQQNTPTTVVDGENIRTPEEYRALANMYYNKRHELVAKARHYYSTRMFPVANFYSRLASEQTRLFDQANTLAASALFENNQKNSDTIDLHNMTVKEALNSLEIFLEIRHEHMKDSKQNSSYLHVITGRGKNSLNGVPRVRPAVIARLRKLQIPFTIINPGLLRLKLYKNT